MYGINHVENVNKAYTPIPNIMPDLFLDNGELGVRRTFKHSTHMFAMSCVRISVVQLELEN